MCAHINKIQACGKASIILFIYYSFLNEAVKLILLEEAVHKKNSLINIQVPKLSPPVMLVL